MVPWTEATPDARGRSLRAALALWCSASATLGAAAGTVGEGSEYWSVWYAMPQMAEARQDFAAVSVGDAVYLIGGCPQPLTFHSSQDLVGRAGPWSDPGYYCGTPGQSDAVMREAARYFPDTRTHETITSAPHARQRHAAAAVNDEIYVIGGIDSTGVPVTAVDVLDTRSLIWRTLETPMQNAFVDLSAFSYRGHLYTVGGFDPNNQWSATTNIQRLHLETGHTLHGAAINSWATVGHLNTARGSAGVAVMDATGSAYVSGGFENVDQSSPLASVESIEMSTRYMWYVAKEIMNLSAPRGKHTMVMLHDRIHVIGGNTKMVANGASTPLTDVEIYDPVEDLWRISDNLPQYFWRRYSCCFIGAKHGDSIYLFGGQGMLEGTLNTAGSFYGAIRTVIEYREKLIASNESPDDDSATDFGSLYILIPVAVAVVVLCAVVIFLTKIVMLLRKTISGISHTTKVNELVFTGVQHARDPRDASSPDMITPSN